MRRLGWVEILSPGVWVSVRFAQYWYEDTLLESRRRPRNLAALFAARRREVIFACCFAETYLVEWVCHDCLGRHLGRLHEFFPSKFKPLQERWRTVTSRLVNARLVPKRPPLHGPDWDAFVDLFRLRNGIVHGDLSRPDDPGVTRLHPDPRVVTAERLGTVPAGWPLKVARAQALELHSAAGTDPPSWLRVRPSTFRRRLTRR